MGWNPERRVSSFGLVRLGQNGQEIEAAVGILLLPDALLIRVDSNAADVCVPIAGGVFVPIEARDASFEAAQLAGQQGLQIFVHHVAAAAHQQGFGAERVLAPRAGEEGPRGYCIAGWRIAAAGGGEREQTGKSGSLAGAEQGGGALVLLEFVFRRGGGVADVFIGPADDGVGAGLLADGPSGGGGGLRRNGRERKRTQSHPGDWDQGRENFGRQKARRPEHLHRLGERVAVPRFHGASDRAIQGGFLTAVLARGHRLACFGTPTIVVEDGAPILGAAGFGRTIFYNY